MHIIRRGVAFPIAVVILLVGVTLWFVDVMARPGSSGPVGLSRHGATTAYTFVDDPNGEIRVGGAREQRPRPTASTAKLITALTVLERRPLAPGEDGPVLTMTGADTDLYSSYAGRGGSAVAVGDGQELSEYEMLVGMLLPSANNLADSLAVWAFGSLSEYRTAANELVRALGMTSTTVGTDASGFSPTTTSTARDLTLLAAAAVRNPVIAEIVAQEEAVLSGVGVVRNTNRLLGRQGVVGLKTGTTGEAGGVFLFAARVGVPGRLVVGAVQGEGRSADDAIDRASRLLDEIGGTES
ncbi:D-alanyl-D-alanine carboxypeptidase [Prescottella agglutinans]|uniref:D-alanyl-D-alanine carboxypeptidase n=1 Tax=Prescottella agglutinans TaxID=1644129 RepID=A0A438B8V6_9NOCA|nr:D-alanyl-D-alanine carboxypeptidase [Prescottella agglutinans]RVW07404.1 D-alanyl-D-alanine carboxypeptidase [Prescottella agglutinans]